MMPQTVERSVVFASDSLLANIILAAGARAINLMLVTASEMQILSRRLAESGPASMARHNGDPRDGFDAFRYGFGHFGHWPLGMSTSTSFDGSTITRLIRRRFQVYVM